MSDKDDSSVVAEKKFVLYESVVADKSVVSNQ